MGQNGKRNTNGSGNIKQRANGSWEGRYTYYDEYGVTQRGSVYAKTKTECRKKLTAIIATVDRTGNTARVSRITYSEWVDQWIDSYGINWKPNTSFNYRQKADKYIIPKIGSLPLSEITPIVCQRLINGLSKQIKAKSVKNIHSILHSSLKRAVMAGLIRSNPASNLELPRIEKPDIHPLMDDDIRRFLSAAEGSEYYHLFITAIFTGMRISELVGLRWEDINFSERYISVNHQLQRSDKTGEYITLSTKNRTSRLVPISTSMVAVLHEVKSKQAQRQLLAGEEWKGEGYVFTNDIGAHYSQPTIQHHMKKIARAAGFENLRFHDLRHTCAILAIQTGADIKSISDMLGHYSTAFTMDVYADVSNTMREQTRERMELAFKNTIG